MAGLAQYSEYFKNPVFTEVIKEVPVPADYIGQRFLPLTETYEIDWNETTVTRQGDMADIIDNGSEIPLTDRDPVSRVSGEIADIGQSYIVTKKELAALMDRGNAQKRKLMEKQLLGKAALVKNNIDARIEWMRWQALGVGTLVYNKSGIILNISFGLPADCFKTAGTKWDQNNCTIVADMELWVQAYLTLNGVKPDVFVTSQHAINHILNDTTVHTQISGLSGKLPTVDELNAFLRGRGLPPVLAFDSQVTYRDPLTGGARTTGRLTDEKKGFYLKEGDLIGQQMLGPTVENDMNPGVFSHTFTMQRPRRDVVEVVAASFPKIINPKLIMICTVLT
jgi:hypothetical protein